MSRIINKIGDPSEIVLRNLSQSPEIVLVFPVTDDNLESRIRWEKVVDTIYNSAITTLVLIDKTDSKSPSKFFQDNFAIHVYLGIRDWYFHPKREYLFLVR